MGLAFPPSASTDPDISSHRSLAAVMSSGRGSRGRQLASPSAPSSSFLFCRCSRRRHSSPPWPLSFRLRSHICCPRASLCRGFRLSHFPLRHLKSHRSSTQSFHCVTFPPRRKTCHYHLSTTRLWTQPFPRSSYHLGPFHRRLLAPLLLPSPLIPSLILPSPAFHVVASSLFGRSLSLSLHSRSPSTLIDPVASPATSAPVPEVGRRLPHLSFLPGRASFAVIYLRPLRAAVRFPP
jgi:hypothetical protein